MKKKTIVIILLVILAIGACLRFYKLGEVPVSPDWDEVALAYDAHSLATTGRDEYGNFLPAVLRSYDDYKPAFYAYLAIPFVETLGLNSVAIRLPAVIIGILAIVAVYFLVKEIFSLQKEKQKNQKKSVEILSLLVAFLFAISPWHLQFSRVAFESSIGLTINICIVLFFLKGLRSKWFLLLSMFLAGLNLSVYQSDRVFTPLLVLALIIIFRKELFAMNKKILLGGVLAGIVAIIPLFMFVVNDQNAFLRAKRTSILNNQTEYLKKNVVRINVDRENHDFLGLVLDNRRYEYMKSIASGYLSHFDPQWLFISGDDKRHHAPRMGLLYLIFLPFILFGIYRLLFGEFDKKTKKILFAWFLLAPVPASITADVPHAVRTLNFLPMYEVFIALGIIGGLLFINKLKYKMILFGLGLILFLGNFFYFLNQYFVQLNYYYAIDWQYGYEKAIPIIEQMKKDYKKVVVSDREPLAKSYMFFLFYLKYPPQDFQKIAVKKVGDFDNVRHFDKYEFYTFQWDEIKQNKDILLIGVPGDFPDRIVSRKIIPYPNGNPAILIVDPKDNP